MRSTVEQLARLLRKRQFGWRRNNADHTIARDGAPVLNRDSVEKILPHRPPSLLVDHVAYNDIGETVVATVIHPTGQLGDAFDKYDVLEATAQAGALLIRQVTSGRPARVFTVPRVVSYRSPRCSRVQMPRYATKGLVVMSGVKDVVWYSSQAEFEVPIFVRATKISEAHFRSRRGWVQAFAYAQDSLNVVCRAHLGFSFMSG